MLDLAKLEQRLFSCVGDIDTAQQLLLPLLRDTNVETRGFAHYHMAVQLYAASGIHTVSALQHIDNALQMLPPGSRDYPAACQQGVVLALHQDDVQAALGYCSRMAEAINGTVALNAWRGRLFHCKAMAHARIAEWHDRFGNRNEAMEAYARAAQWIDRMIEWLSDNVGPWHEHDRGCQLRIGRTWRSVIRWMRGDRIGAVSSILPHLAQLEADDAFAYCLWSGRIALLDGQSAAAETLHREALEHSRRLRDHRLTWMVFEAMTEFVPADRISGTALELIREAAAARNVGLVDRLQGYLAGSDVGRNYDAVTDPEGDCGAGCDGRHNHGG